jgi:hypothetical protein
VSTVWTTNPSTGRMVIGANADDDTVLQLFDAVFTVENTVGSDDEYMAVEVLFDRDGDVAAAWAELLRWTALAEDFDLELWWNFDTTRSMAILSVLHPDGDL